MYTLTFKSSINSQLVLENDQISLKNSKEIHHAYSETCEWNV